VRRGSAVDIATVCGLDHQGVRVRVPVGSRILTFPYLPDLLWGPPASRLMCTGGTLPGVKRQGRKADHSPSTSAEFKKTWMYTSAPQYAFMAWCLARHKDSVTVLSCHGFCWYSSQHSCGFPVPPSCPFPSSLSQRHVTAAYVHQSVTCLLSDAAIVADVEVVSLFTCLSVLFMIHFQLLHTPEA
jgi:hypothetical protein